MAVINAAFPILPGKTDAWQAWADEISPGGPRRADWEDHNRRYGLTRQVAPLQRTPTGDFVAVFWEGDNPGAMMAAITESENEFDKWFLNHMGEIHGLNPAEMPPGPPAEVKLEFNA